MECKYTSLFSYFPGNIYNVGNQRAVTIERIYKAITGPYFKEITDKLRSITDKDGRKVFKAENFSYVTFSGSFTRRRASGLITRSWFFGIDIDHVTDWQRVWCLIIDRTSPILCFRSPSGDGIKVVYVIDPSVDHEAYFEALSRWIKNQTGQTIDIACKDVSRACFIPHDPNAYFNQNPRVYGADFVQSFAPKLPQRPRIQASPVFTTGPVNQDRPADLHKTFSILRRGTEKRVPYTDGNLNRFTSTLIYALRRNGVPLEAAINMTYAYCSNRKEAHQVTAEYLTKLCTTIYKAQANQPLANNRI